jgi:sugar phosphate isomerase/epimerase
MYWYGHPLDKLYGFAETLAPYVRYCHAKNERYPDDQKNVQRQPGWEYGKYAVSIRDGDIDFRRILRIYAKGGFKGTVTIEDDSLGKLDEAGKKKTLIDDVKFLREIIAGL